MEYTRIAEDEVTSGIVDDGARAAHIAAVHAHIHAEQHKRLHKHDNPHAAQVGKLQHKEHASTAEKRQKTADRKIAASNLNKSDLDAAERQALEQYLAQLEREHLSNKVAAADMEAALANGEIEPSDPVQTEQGQMNVATQSEVFKVNIAIIETAHEVASERLAALDAEDTKAKPRNKSR